jgi:hypothetical protein
MKITGIHEVEEFRHKVLLNESSSKELFTLCVSNGVEQYIYMYDTIQEWKLCDDHVERCSYLGFIVEKYSSIITNEDIISVLSAESQRFMENEESESIITVMAELEHIVLTMLMVTHMKAKEHVDKAEAIKSFHQKKQIIQPKQETSKLKKVARRFSILKAFKSESE